MQTIKFSHRYTKMPPDVEKCPTIIVDIAVVHYNDLTPEMIQKDTHIVGGQYYELPKTKLIWIKLRSEVMQDGVLTVPEWGTMRRYTPAKLEYYNGLIGQQVKIEIKK